MNTVANEPAPIAKCADCLGVFPWDELAQHEGRCGECAAVLVRLLRSPEESAPVGTGCSQALPPPGASSAPSAGADLYPRCA